MRFDVTPAHPHELLIPPPAQQDPHARELLRVWAANGSQHIAVQTGLWPDAATWGIALADLARHVALSYEQTTGESYENALNRIKQGFDAEWSHPTDTPKGGLVD